MNAIYPKLKDSGTVWVNIGDTYSGSGGSGGDYNKGGLRENQPKVGPIKVPDIPQKCLMLIPHRYAIGCIERGWIVRNDIIWAKRNGMPESVTDRFSKKHEYMFFFVKKEKYYFDLDAIRDKTITKSNVRNKREESYGSELGVGAGTREWNNPNGKNPGDVSDFWDIPTRPNSSNHYATYNEALITRPILAGCPEGGIIYDPFMGTGTTAESALRLGRKYIGSEMSEEYYRIAEKRLEPLLSQLNLF